ncbi:GntR family transcriptional regulator, partial [Anaerorhabdus sp.]
MAKNNNQIPNRVYEALKAEILSMRLEPGYSISEIETSKRFNVSRTPVRDAFRRLESDGLIEVKPHIGTFVSLIDLETISDIMYMREKIEIGIVEDLATIITQAQIFRLKVILVKQKELLSRESDDKELSLEFINLDNDFHRMIFELAGKEGVWEMLNQLQNHYLRFRVFIDLNDKKRLSKLLDAH